MSYEDATSEERAVMDLNLSRIDNLLQCPYCRYADRNIVFVREDDEPTGHVDIFCPECGAEVFGKGI